MQIKKLSLLLLSAFSCAALLNGCGSSGKTGTSGNVALVDEGSCIACHSTTADPVAGTSIVQDYGKSAHNPAAGGTGCQGCHGGGAQHNGVGPLPHADPLKDAVCAECHVNVPLAAVQGLDFNTTCAVLCHSSVATSTNPVSIHGAETISATTNRKKDDCVGCHNIPVLQHGTNLVGDNSGVRAITGPNGEFEVATANRANASGYRSHHIYNGVGLDPQNAQCIVCHLEGTVAPGRNVIVDSNVHKTDGKVHLRSGNTAIVTDANAVWDPLNPNHTNMDNFCMSCHNAAGAVTAFANVSSALKGATLPGTPSAKNPFGDLLQNAYDGLIRPQVVAVYEQFDTGNVAHHAVRGQKYSARTRAASANPAVFTQYSGPTNGGKIHINRTTGSPSVEQYFSYGVGKFNNISTSGSAAGPGPLFSGSRQTLYEAGLFVAQYTTLSNITLGDDSTLHCGDCHSVGQWKPGSANAVVFNNATSAQLGYTIQPTTVAIGAHGAKNEYLLRTSDGSDALHTQGATGKATVIGGVTQGYRASSNGTYVCYLCHRQEAYGDNNFFQTDSGVGTTSFRDHAGLHYNNGCDSSGQQSVGKVGYANRVKALSGNGLTAFGYTCGHCHSSGNQVFGGIHGNASADGSTLNIRFLSYSTDGTDIIGSTLPGYTSRSYATEHDTLKVVARLPFRFMGGTGLRYNGGGTASKWEAKTLNTKHREGCYNLNANTSTTRLWNTTTPLQSLAGGPGGNAILNNNGNDSAIGAAAGDYSSRTVQNDNATSGWGSCSHHSGTTTASANQAPTRSVQRPLIY